MRYDDLLLELGDSYMIYVSNTLPSEMCVIQNQYGVIGSENAGEMNINCYDHADITASLSVLL